MTSTYGYLLAGVGFAGHLVSLFRLSRYRTSASKPSLLENWTKAVNPINYSEAGRRLLPWVWVFVGLFAAGVVILVASS